MKKQVYALLLLLFIPYYSFAQWLTSGTNIYNSNTGNVGVGTSTPSEKLHINGTIRGNSTGGALRVKTQFGYLEIGPQNSFYSQFYTDITRGFYFNNSLTVNGNISSFNVSDLNLQTYDGSTYYNRMTIVRSTGFIGVNKTNPAYQLDVAGTVNATSYLLNGSPLSTSQWTTNGTTINYATGNVGIGTTSPAATLDIVSPTSTALRLSSDNSCIQQIYTAGNDSYFMGGFILYRSRGTVASPLSMQANDRVGAFGGNSWINGAYRGTASMEIFTGSTPSATSNPGYIIFKTVANNNTVAAERVRISESGFVGINKTNPAYHIDVAGTVNATSYLVNGSPLSTSQWTTNGTTINYATGNVGIGQSTPAFKLDVAGTINASSILINGQPFASRKQHQLSCWQRRHRYHLSRCKTCCEGYNPYERSKSRPERSGCS
jgi:hypothetical protein